MIKQVDYNDKIKVDELFKQIKKGKSTIKDCLIDINIFKEQ